MRNRILLLAVLVLLSAGMTLADEEGPGYMGVTLTFVENVDVGAEDNGVYIDNVMTGSAAEAAGLEPHDKIVALDGITVGSYDILQAVLAETRPSDSVSVTVNRDGAEQTVSVTLGRRPVKHGMRWGVVLEEKRAFLGVHIQELNPQLAGYFEVEGGVLVTEVIDGGPAMEAGIQAGDVLMEVNQEPLQDPASLHELLGRVEPGDAVSVRLQRRGRPLTVHVTAGDHEELPATLDLRLKHHLHLQEIGEGGTAEGTLEIVPPEGEAKQRIHIHDDEND